MVIWKMGGYNKKMNGWRNGEWGFGGIRDERYFRIKIYKNLKKIY